jgi:uncharacterized protein
VKRIIAEAKSAGIEPKYLQTDFIQIHPRYKREHEKEVFLGFFVKMKVVMTIRDPSKFDDLLSSALQTGATNVYGINFRTTELKKYREQTRSLAVKAAHEEEPSPEQTMAPGQIRVKAKVTASFLLE